MTAVVSINRATRLFARHTISGTSDLSGASVDLIDLTPGLVGKVTVQNADMAARRFDVVFDESVAITEKPHEQYRVRLTSAGGIPTTWPLVTVVIT